MTVNILNVLDGKYQLERITSLGHYTLSVQMLTDFYFFGEKKYDHV